MFIETHNYVINLVKNGFQTNSQLLIVTFDGSLTTFESWQESTFISRFVNSSVRIAIFTSVLRLKRTERK